MLYPHGPRPGVDAPPRRAARLPAASRRRLVGDHCRDGRRAGSRKSSVGNAIPKQVGSGHPAANLRDPANRSDRSEKECLGARSNSPGGLFGNPRLCAGRDRRLAGTDRCNHGQRHSRRCSGNGGRHIRRPDARRGGISRRDAQPRAIVRFTSGPYVDSALCHGAERGAQSVPGRVFDANHPVRKLVVLGPRQPVPANPRRRPCRHRDVDGAAGGACPIGDDRVGRAREGRKPAGVLFRQGNEADLC